MRSKIFEDLTNLVDLTGRYIIFQMTNEENSLVTEYLQVEDYSVPELRILRNMLVVVLSHEMEEGINLQDKTKFELSSSWLTVVTGIIDNEIFKKGGAV